MYNTVWNMEEVDLEYPRTDVNCGTDLIFYIEMDPPGNGNIILQHYYLKGKHILDVTVAVIRAG